MKIVTDINYNCHTQSINVKQDSPTNLKFICTCVTNICDIPVEIKQKIAFNLNSKDYASLRETCKSMSNSLDTFSAISNKLKNIKYPGELEGKLREIETDRLVRALFENKSKKDIAQALKNCFVNNDKSSNEETSVGTEYLPFPYVNGKVNRINDIINLCRTGIKTIIPSGYSVSFMPEICPGKLWLSSMSFCNEELNTNSLKDIFCSFNNAFHASNGEEKFVIATMVCKLKNYWCENPPNNMDKSDIKKCSSLYPELFFIGNNVIKKILECEI